MKKIIVITFLFLSLALAYGQKKEKIKGNREVITRLYTVAPFLRVETDEDLTLFVKKAADTTQIQLKADENLHEVLKWDVNNGVLKLWLSKKIISKKKFEITLFVGKQFQGFLLHKYAKAVCEDKIRLKNLFVELHDRASIEGGFSVQDSVGVHLFENAKLRLDLEAESVHAVLDKHSSWVGVVFAKQMQVKMNRSAHIQLDGRVKNLEINAMDHAAFDGRKLHITKSAMVVLSGKTSVRIFGKNANRLTVDLRDAAILELGGHFSDYKIEAFLGEAAIRHFER